MIIPSIAKANTNATSLNVLFIRPVYLIDSGFQFTFCVLFNQFAKPMSNRQRRIQRHVNWFAAIGYRNTLFRCLCLLFRPVWQGLSVPIRSEPLRPILSQCSGHTQCHTNENKQTFDLLSYVDVSQIFSVNTFFF